MPDPTELDRLDPAPCIRQDPPARPPRRRPGLQESAVRKDLKRMPPDLRAGAIAAAALALARQLDTIAMTPRDYSGHVRELRMCMTQLREWNPAGEIGDATDAARDRMDDTRKLYAVD